MRVIVRARMAFLVIGGTGAGKTTLLSGMLAKVDPAERIVCVDLSPGRLELATAQGATDTLVGGPEVVDHGVEMRVERIEAKRKLSQNKSAADFEGVIAGLEAAGDAGATEIASLMRATRAMSGDPDGN